MTKLFGYLSYRDAPAGIQWLEGLGFEATARQDGPDGSVAHAELRLGDATVMIASDGVGYEMPPLKGASTGGGLYIRVDDVQPIYDAALTAGGESVFEPEETEWGTVRARVLDPEGHEWSFGTYEPGRTW